MRAKYFPKPGHPDTLQIQVPHFRQRYNWDCGLSCVIMILPSTKREHFLRNFHDICKEEGFNRSTWTIDLCYLLKRYDIVHRYYTITLGIHPGYKRNSFYQHILTKDENRVNRKFEDADRVGIRVRKASLNITSILNHLIEGPAILLTNTMLLKCDICKFNKLSTELKKCLPWPTTAYQGHYIVLCGYDSRKQKVFYRNPSLSNRICVMPLHTLEEARKSYGTDEDIILIYS